ncbi:MAG: restriction endonuclease subunit S, partial [Spirochaetota bacterium]
NSRKLPIAYLATGKFWVNNHSHIISGVGIFSNEWLLLTIENYQISGYITGAAQPKLSQESLNKIKIMTATNEIHKKFNSCIRPLFDQIEVLKHQNQNLKKTRDLLLPRLMSGKLELAP